MKQIKRAAPMQANARDVKLGRGRGCDHWPGNVAFRREIARRRFEYTHARKRDKRAIAMAVVQWVRDAGGRFVRVAPNGGYRVASLKVATAKALQALREKPVPENHVLQSPGSVVPEAIDSLSGEDVVGVTPVLHLEPVDQGPPLPLLAEGSNSNALDFISTDTEVLGDFSVSSMSVSTLEPVARWEERAVAVVASPPVDVLTICHAVQEDFIDGQSVHSHDFIGTVSLDTDVLLHIARATVHHDADVAAGSGQHLHPQPTDVLYDPLYTWGGIVWPY